MEGGNGTGYPSLLSYRTGKFSMTCYHKELVSSLLLHDMVELVLDQPSLVSSLQQHGMARLIHMD